MTSRFQGLMASDAVSCRCPTPPWPPLPRHSTIEPVTKHRSGSRKPNNCRRTGNWNSWVSRTTKESFAGTLPRQRAIITQDQHEGRPAPAWHRLCSTWPWEGQTIFRVTLPRCGPVGHMWTGLGVSSLMQSRSRSHQDICLNAGLTEAGATAASSLAGGNSRLQKHQGRALLGEPSRRT